MLERDIGIQYFIPQLLIEGLVIMERVNKLQIWDRLGLSSNIEQTTNFITKETLQIKKVNEKKFVIKR